jgi:hypothetical protein
MELVADIKLRPINRQKESPYHPFLGGLIFPEAGLVAMEKRKFPGFAGDRTASSCP